MSRWVASKASVSRCNLAGIVLIVGVAMAGLHLVVDKPGDAEPAAEQTEPPREIGAFEAASAAEAPTWYHFTLPFVGCVGVLLGGRLKGKREAPSAGEAP